MQPTVKYFGHTYKLGNEGEWINQGERDVYADASINKIEPMAHETSVEALISILGDQIEVLEEGEENVEDFIEEEE